MMFRDREDAVLRMVEALTQYRGQRTLVLAMSRGAVPMARLMRWAVDSTLTGGDTKRFADKMHVTTPCKNRDDWQAATALQSNQSSSTCGYNVAGYK